MEIDVRELDSRRKAGENLAILDVREPWEVDICRLEGAITIPLGQIPGSLDQIPKDRPVIVICHHGFRSANATAWLRAQGFSQATNLFGGIDAWARSIDPSMPTY